MASGGSLPINLEDIVDSLEKTDIKNFKKIILENISTRDPWLVNICVDNFYRTQSTVILEILGTVRELHSKALMEKLQDGVKQPETRLPALQLILYLVHKELPWCHQLVETPLFHNILRYLKTETDVPMLMTSLMIVVILLPSVPVLTSPFLPQILDVFGRLSLFCTRKPANTPDVFFLHLQVALYSLFHRLYGMYPCRFLDFISKFFGQKENIHAYEEVVLPMLDRVRLHPGLIMGSSNNETALSRWKNQETQDIVVSCSKLSLDLVEGSWEGSHCPIFRSVHELSKYRDAVHKEGGQADESIEKEPVAKPAEDARLPFLSACPELVVVGESPSVLIGLATPPSSHRNTPAASFLEANTSGGTPDTSSRQATPCYVEDTDKGDKTPLSRSSSRSILQQQQQQQPSRQLDSGKKSSGLVTPKAMVTTTPNTTPITPGLLTAAPFTSPVTLLSSSSTPLRSQSSAFGVPMSGRSPASRHLNFSSSGEHCPPALDESEAEKSEAESGSQEVIEEASSTEAEAVATDKQKAGESQSKESREDPDDLEVEEINELEDKFDTDGSPASSISTLASQADVTAESVRQFMKKVNRIRFNSLTSNSSSDLDLGPRKGNARSKRTRARSCPPFKRLGQPLSKDERKSSSDPHQNQARGERSSRKAKAEYNGNEDSEVCQNAEEISEDSSEETSSSSQGIKGKLLPRDPVCQMMIRRSTKNASTQVSPPFPPPVNPSLQFLFAPAKLAVCTGCSEQLVVSNTQSSAPMSQASCVNTTVKGTAISLFNSWPAPELLDQYLGIGSELHAKELTQIPLTSKETVNWTHFGGVPPADEVNILRGQILLLHAQLLYERHKRANHAKRNRRLLRKIAHVVTLEEQQKTLLSQIKIQEQEIQQLSVSVKLLQEDNRRLNQTQESEDYHNLVHYKTALKENKDLKASSIQLKNLLVTQREDYEKLQKKLDNVQHRNQDNEKELKMCKEKLASTEHLKQQVIHLEKEVLLMQELQQKCQEKLHQSLPSNQIRGELTNLITSLQAQLADTLSENKKKSKLYKTYQAMSVDMEGTIRSKEKAIGKLKEDICQIRSSHAEQLKALEDGRMALIHINQNLEASIMELQCQLDQQKHRKMMEGLRANRAKARDKANRTGQGQSKSQFQPASASSLSRELKSSTGGEKAEEKEERGVESKGPSPSSPSSPFTRGMAIDCDDEAPSSSLNQASASSSPAFPNNGEEDAGGVNMGDDPPSSSSLPSASSAVRGRAETEVTDSGVASRSSYRLDSDVSMQSVSETSIATGDSGCWQK